MIKRLRRRNVKTWCSRQSRVVNRCEYLWLASRRLRRNPPSGNKTISFLFLGMYDSRKWVLRSLMPWSRCFLPCMNDKLKRVSLLGRKVVRIEFSGSHWHLQTIWRNLDVRSIRFQNWLVWISSPLSTWYSAVHRAERWNWPSAWARHWSIDD